MVQEQAPKLSVYHPHTHRKFHGSWGQDLGELSAAWHARHDGLSAQEVRIASLARSRIAENVKVTLPEGGAGVLQDIAALFHITVEVITGPRRRTPEVEARRVAALILTRRGWKANEIATLLHRDRVTVVGLLNSIRHDRELTQVALEAV